MVSFLDHLLDLPGTHLVCYLVLFLHFADQVLQVLDLSFYLLNVFFGCAQAGKLFSQHIFLELKLPQLSVVSFADIIAVLAAAKCLHQVHGSLVRVIGFFVHQPIFELLRLPTIGYMPESSVKQKNGRISVTFSPNARPIIWLIIIILAAILHKMTLYFRDDSSYAKTQQLELSSKMETRQVDENEQITQLCQKICQMQKNYIAMQKHYSDKIKALYSQINEKDVEFKKLETEMQLIKTIAIEHKKKVEELNKNAVRKSVQPRVKSKSPVITARPTNNKASLNNGETEQPKSPSPKNESKKISPTHKPFNAKRPTLVTKTSLGSTDSGNLPKNTSSQKFIKKSVSPKNSYEKSKKILPKVDEVESIKIVKKTGTGVTSFREKPPAFK